MRKQADVNNLHDRFDLTKPASISSTRPSHAPLATDVIIDDFGIDYHKMLQNL